MNPRKYLEKSMKERRIGGETKMVTNQLVAVKLVKRREDLLENILRTSYNNVPRGIGLAAYSVVEPVISDLLRRDVICKGLDSHIAKLFNTDGETNSVLNKNSDIKGIYKADREVHTTENGPYIADRNTLIAKA